MTGSERTTLILYPGQVLTVTPTQSGNGTVYELSDQGLINSAITAVSGSASTFGPYQTLKQFAITCTNGVITPVVTQYDTTNYALDADLAGYQAVNSTLSLPSNVKIITNAGAPTDGGAGTGANTAGKGSLCIDTTNGKAYINGGTLASPTWKLVTSAA